MIRRARRSTATVATFAPVFTLFLLALGLRLTAPAAAVASSAWQWPVTDQGGPRIVHAFDPPNGPYAPGHRGVDLAATAGEPIRAAAEGLVSFAGWVAGRPVVVVSHGDDLRTTYEPVLPAVAVGQRVAAGDPLGAIQPAGGHCAPLVCLHWGLRRGDTYLDPIKTVRRGPPRLLPVWDPQPAAELRAPEPSRAAPGGSGADAKRTSLPTGRDDGGAAHVAVLAGSVAALGGSAALALVARRGRGQVV